MPVNALSIEAAPVRLSRAHLLWAGAILLFGLNVYVAHRLFTLEFSAHLESNEGTFFTISRIMAEHPFDLHWWPFWDTGIPFQNTYLPLLHALVAAFARITGRSPALGFHAISAFFYCLGPVSLFLMAAILSQRIGYSFVSSLLYSLTSPASLLIPVVGRDAGGVWNARRLQVLGFYGEGPHITTLALLPFAVLFLYLSLKHRRRRYYLLTGLLLVGVVLSNAFGTVDFVIMTFCLLATMGFERVGRNLLTTIVIGAGVYLFVSPCLPPSLLRAIRINTQVPPGSRAGLGLFVIGIGFLLLWWIMRRWRLTDYLRFVVLFAFVISSIPALLSMFDISVVPQPHRYEVEMEMALCLAVPFAAALVLDRAHKNWTIVLVGLLLIFSIRQTIHYVRYARRLIQPVDITTTIPYQTAMWMKQHYRTERVMINGSASYFFNYFTDIPQLHGGHEPNVPNWLLNMVVFTVESGMNAGSRDAEFSILWLKALGAQAVMVPGPTSIEYYRPFTNPRKFDSVLPVLWDFEGTRIYAIPNRSSSLAHVVPGEALVSRQPINGLDTQQVASYVAALDNPSYPLAEMQWHNLHSFHIAAKRQAGQAVSIQTTYHPGWHAIANGKETPVTKDGLGLMVIRPECRDCSIEMSYDGGLEIQIARILSALVTIAVLGYCGAGLRKSRAVSQPHGA